MAQGTRHITRTTDLLKAEGYTYGIVERRIAPTPYLPHGKTIDYLGLIDVIAIKGDITRGIQVCGSDFAPHVKKMLGYVQEGDSEKEAIDAARRVENARKWLESPYRTLELWGWRKLVQRKQDGSKSKRPKWEPRVRIFELEDYDGTQIL